MGTWDRGEAGLVELPDGRWVVGRGVGDGGSEPDFALIALGRRPAARPYRSVWVRWPDFALPLRHARTVRAIREAHARAATERVAVMCGHGTGRTGAILAVLAVLAGIEPDRAVGWVRAAYRPGSVETPWQRGWVRATGRSVTG